MERKMAEYRKERERDYARGREGRWKEPVNEWQERWANKERERLFYSIEVGKKDRKERLPLPGRRTESKERDTRKESVHGPDSTDREY